MYAHLSVFGLLIGLAYIWIGMFTHATFNKRTVKIDFGKAILVALCVIWSIFWVLCFFVIFVIIGFYIIRWTLRLKFTKIFNKSATFLGNWFNGVCLRFANWRIKRLKYQVKHITELNYQ